MADEVEHVLDLEQERGSKVLSPIRLDEAIMESKIAWAAKIKRTRHIGDFTNWSNGNSYQKAFDRLLEDLKVEDEKDSD